MQARPRAVTGCEALLWKMHGAGETLCSRLWWFTPCECGPVCSSVGYQLFQVLVTKLSSEVAAGLGQDAVGRGK